MNAHRARRRFSQNFLHDPLVIQRIIAAIAPQPDHHLLEIGPGLGALTVPLAERAGRLDMVEIDRDLAAGLRERFAGRDSVTVHEADAMHFDLAGITREPHSLRVVGNLPYNISSPLLFRLLAQRHWIADLHLMLQEEVVERLVAPPGSRVYGRLGVMAGLWCESERVLRVGPGAFKPAPRVSSAVVAMRVRAEPLVPVRSSETFARVVSAAFGQRRKTLRNSLRELLEADAIAACGVDPRARAETLDLVAFAALADAVHDAGRAR